MTVGERIKFLRTQKGMTLEELGNMVGVGKSTVRKWENGMIANMRRDKISKLANALEVTPTFLMGWQEDPNLSDRDDKLSEIDQLLSKSGYILQCESYDDPIFVIKQKNGNFSIAIPDAKLLGKYDQLKKANSLTVSALITDYSSIKDPYGHYRIPVLTTVAAGKPIYAEEDVIEWIDYDKDPGDHVRACRIEGNSMIPRIQDGDTVIFDTDLGWEDGDVVIATVNGDHATCKRIKRYADGIALLSDNADMRPMYFSRDEVVELPVKIVGRVIEVRGKI